MNSTLLLCFVVLLGISHTFGTKYSNYDGYELLDSYPISSYGKNYYGPGDYDSYSGYGKGYSGLGGYSGYGKGYGGLGGYGYGSRGYGRKYGGYGRRSNKAATKLLAALLLKSLADKSYGYDRYGDRGSYGYGGYGGYGKYGGYGGYDSYDGYKK